MYACILCVLQSFQNVNEHHLANESGHVLELILKLEI